MERLRRNLIGHDTTDAAPSGKPVSVRAPELARGREYDLLPGAAIQGCMQATMMGSRPHQPMLSVQRCCAHDGQVEVARFDEVERLRTILRHAVRVHLATRQEDLVPGPGEQARDIDHVCRERRPRGQVR